jgi:hypothetical protein
LGNSFSDVKLPLAQVQRKLALSAQQSFKHTTKGKDQRVNVALQLYVKQAGGPATVLVQHPQFNATTKEIQ